VSALLVLSGQGWNLGVRAKVQVQGEQNLQEYPACAGL
jgi:hypothetical protein